MAQGEGFKHITVTAPEEDDVVIVAGATNIEESPAEELPNEAPIAEELPAEEPAAEASAPRVEEQPAQASEQVKKPVQPAKQPAKQAARKKDAYHETTLEDLQGNSMPMAQKIVIIAAIICIIGAVIYCVAFMG